MTVGPTSNARVGFNPVNPNSGVRRLQKGETVFGTLENQLRDAGIVDKNGNIDIDRIEDVQGKFYNEDGKYSAKNVDGDPVRAKVKPYRAIKGNIINKVGFGFEMEWTVKIKGRPEPIKLTHPLFTNVEVPDNNNALKYERARNRAFAIATAFQITIKSALDPQHQSHVTSLIQKLRHAHSLDVTFKGESEKDFSVKKTYLQGPENSLWRKIRGTSVIPDSKFSVSTGEGEDAQTINFDLNKIFATHQKAKTLISKASKMQNTRIMTGRPREFDEMRRLEYLDRMKIDEITKQRLDEEGIHENILAHYARTQLSVGKNELNNLYHDFYPISAAIKRVLGLGNSGIQALNEDLTAKIAAPDAPTKQELSKIELLVAKYNGKYHRMEHVTKDTERNLELLTKLQSEFGTSLPPSYRKRAILESMDVRKRDEVRVNLDQMNANYAALKARFP